MNLGAKYFLPNAHWPEFHLIASQRAGFVRKDIVQLAQILNYAHILHLRPLILLHSEHLNVARNEPRDEKFYHFSRDVQWNRNESVQKLNVPNECQKALKDGRVAKLYVKVHRLAVLLLLSRLAVPIATEHRDRSCQHELCNEDLDHKHVHLFLNITLFVAAELRIHHNSGLLACIYHEPNDPFSVLQLSSFQQKLLLRQWEKLMTHVHFAIEWVQVTIWWLGNDLTCY